MLVTNGKAGVVQKYAYDAYGNNYEGSFAGSNNIGYNGKRYDGGTGWYDYGFRDYDSRTGRFTTVDPIRDGMNWYAYCGGDPINCVDLWGRQSAYLPGGGTSFNGSCPEMNYNIEEYTKKNETISNVTEGIFLRKNNELGVLIDKLTGSKKEKEAINIKNQLDKEFFLLTNNTKAKGEYDSDKDGKYNEEEIKKFVIYVNDTMLLNYSNSTNVGPYVVKTPQLTNKKADEFLNPKYQEDLSIYQSFNIPNNNNITNIQLSINSSKIDVPFLDIFDTKNKIKNK